MADKKGDMKQNTGIAAAILTGVAIFLGGLLAAAVAAPAAPAFPEARPYGPLPEAMTWRAPPSWSAELAPRSAVEVPADVSELDAWLVNSEGRPAYRLRQRPAPGGWRFTRAHRHRTLARYWRGEGRAFSAPVRRLYVYGWAG